MSIANMGGFAAFEPVPAMPEGLVAPSTRVVALQAWQGQLLVSLSDASLLFLRKDFGAEGTAAGVSAGGSNAKDGAGRGRHDVGLAIERRDACNWKVRGDAAIKVVMAACCPYCGQAACSATRTVVTISYTCACTYSRIHALESPSMYVHACAWDLNRRNKA